MFERTEPKRPATDDPVAPQPPERVMRVGPLDLRQHRFRTVMRGYDKTEVVALLTEAADELVGRSFEGVPDAEVMDEPVRDVLAQPGLGLLAGARSAEVTGPHGLRDEWRGHERRELVEVLERGQAADEAGGLDDAQRATQ